MQQQQDPHDAMVAAEWMNDRQRALLAALDDWPVRLPLLAEDEFLDSVRHLAKSKAWLDGELATALEDRDAIDPVLRRALVASELLTRRMCELVADECERRRTGVAPRARRMN